MRVMFNLRGRVRYPELLPLFKDHRDDFLIYLGTNTSSTKIAQIRRRPEASLLFARPEAYHSLMLAGRLEIVEDPAVRRALWRKGWEIYYPAGVDDPDYTALKFQASYGKGWHHSRNYSFRIGERS
jgi:general stress protein 26